MPKKEHTIALNEMESEAALALGYEAMKNLRWTIQFAGPDKILGKSRKKWNTYGEQIIIVVSNGQLTISSEMVNGESYDILGNNKKNIASFVKAFELAKSKTALTTIGQNKVAIDTLRAATINAAALEEQQALEVNKAMNLSGSNLNVTYTIIGINVLVFILMVLGGAGIFEPNGYVHVAWGSNYSPLTLSGDWWRLITNIFLHFGIIHLAMNMYCLFMVGIFLEPMLGKAKYLTAYLCTGVLASLTSLWWHTETVNSAGASGAIFGLYGLFLALLTTSLIPKVVRDVQLKSIGIFVAYNLIYGMKSGVDNSAHVGGLVSGFVIGYLFGYGIKKERAGQKATWMMPAVVLFTLGMSYAYITKNKVSETERQSIVNAIAGASFKDSEKFNNDLISFDTLHQQARSFFADSSLTDEQLKSKIDTVALPAWKHAESLLTASKTYDISPKNHEKATILLEYIELSRKELDLLKQMIAEGTNSSLQLELDQTKAKADSVFEKAVSL
ncbi:MAG: rhomboid family intramembrane serine protease [Chitinophagaceae bacterium]